MTQIKREANILLTGAGGQVATALARQLESLDIDHVALSRKDLDITSLRQVSEVMSQIRPTIVINCAAYNHVDKAEDEPEIAYAVNRDGPANLAKVCSEFSSALVHYSTDYVFDGQQDAAYTEESTANPLGVYGASKLAGEHAVLQSDAPHLVLRVSWVFGRIGKSFVDSVLAWAAKGPLKIAADQKSVPCDAEGLAAATIQAAVTLTETPSLSGLYHFAMGPPVTRLAYAQAIVDEASRLGIIAPVSIQGVPSDFFATAATRPSNSVLDGARFRERFGVEPGDWRDGLNDYLEALRTKR